MFTVDDYYELLALNRALMETRYHADNVKNDTRGSALLSRVHVRVVNEIIASLERDGKEREAEGWRDWMRLETRSIELPEIMAYLRDAWPRLTTESQRREVVVNHLRPFTFSEDDVRSIIEELNQSG